MRNRLFSVMLVLILALGITALTAAQEDPTAEPDMDSMMNAAATLMTADGQEAGRVAITSWNDKLLFTADLVNLPPGFHGYHIHTTGSCEDTEEGAFMAAGDHLNPEGVNHPDHSGDLPTLLVNEDGIAYLSVASGRVTFDELLDEDGSAIIVHSNANNFANIPERYGGPDEETLSAGDSGDRIACGVIEQDVSAMSGMGEAESTPAG